MHSQPEAAAPGLVTCGYAEGAHCYVIPRESYSRVSRVLEKAANTAIAAIEALESVAGKVVRLRMEELNG